MEEPRDLLFASTWEGKRGQCANGCAMWRQPNDLRMVALRHSCDAILKGGEPRFGENGPFLVQDPVRTEGLERNVAPWWEFCPYPWGVVDRMAFVTNREYLLDRLRLARHVLREITQEEFRAGHIRKGTRAVHLHNEIWRNKGLSKDRTYHRGSLVGSFQRRHGIV